MKWIKNALLQLFIWIKQIVFWISMEISYRISKMKKYDFYSPVELSLKDTIAYAKELSKKWNYEWDPLRGMINTIHPQTGNHDIIAGDCDDFASVVLGHYEKPEDTYLLTYFPRKIYKAHTVALIKDENGYTLINWGRVSHHKIFDEVLDNLELYAKSPLDNVYIAQWDYKKRRFKSLKNQN